MVFGCYMDDSGRIWDAYPMLFMEFFWCLMMFDDV